MVTDVTNSMPTPYSCTTVISLVLHDVDVYRTPAVSGPFAPRTLYMYSIYKKIANENAVKCTSSMGPDAYVLDQSFLPNPPFPFSPINADTAFFQILIVDADSLLLLPRTRDVLLHSREVVVDGIRGRGRRRRPIHAFPELVLDGGAARGVVARGGPARCTCL